MQVIYADTLFMINLIVNYLIMLTSAKLCALQVGRIRLVLSAALGGVYSVLTLIYPFFQLPAIKISVGILMVMAAFGGKRFIFKIIVTVFCVSAAFAGIIYGLTLMTGGDTSNRIYISVSFRMLIFAFGISWFVISLFFKRMANVSSEYVSITAGYTGKNTSFTALRDTGHSLADPITGCSVIIAGVEALCPLFDKTVIPTLKKPAAIALSELGDIGYAFRLIPYSAVGVENGMLLAFRPDFVRVNGKESSEYLIAVSPNQVSDGGAYSALIGVDNY